MSEIAVLDCTSDRDLEILSESISGSAACDGQFGSGHPFAAVVE